MKSSDSPSGRVWRVGLLLGGLSVSGVVYLAIVSHTGRGLPCLLYRLTGHPCGSCGLTRALAAVLRLELRTAFGFHPLWPLYVAWGLWVALSNTVAYIRRGELPLLPAPLWIHLAAVAVVTAFGIWRCFS